MTLSKEILRQLDTAWLNVDVDENKLYNPLIHIPPQYREKPNLYYTYLMSKPEYFYFICKEILNISLAPFQAVILKELWTHKYPMLIGSRGLAKSFLLAVYALLRAMIIPNRKILLCGPSFRQSKIVYEYICNIYNSAPILRDILAVSRANGPHNAVDRCVFTIGDSKISALPIGYGGEKIRGERATEILVDEIKSHDKQILEEVIFGFAAVNANPVESYKKRMRELAAERLGIQLEEDATFRGNQIIVSGTAYYDFNHAATYWKTWKAIINSRGDKKKLLEVFPGGVPDNFNWQNYSVIRLPVELLPPGYMDEDSIARSKATLHSGVYENEYSAIFSKDSKGFFKASLINSCIACEENNIVHASCGKVVYRSIVKGHPEYSYVMGIDPASEVDNFAITITELHPDHRRIVYCWTTNSNDFKEKRKAGIIEETDYYGYCARKIRDLMSVFNIVHIAIDSQGGGKAVYESLHDKDKLKEGEQLIWEIIDDEKSKDSDGYTGLHIVELVNFASYEYTSEANHGLRKDMEDKVLLFPEFNAITLAFETGNLMDTLEDNVIEIEELKSELTKVVVEVTPSGRERWDTPEVKLSGETKGRLRKDRYSSLVMANMASRRIARKMIFPKYETIGGFAGYMKVQKENKNDFTGPQWVLEAYEGLYDG